MTFNTYISSYLGATPNFTNQPTKTISIYPISSVNLEGIKILIDNCMRMGSGVSSNVQVASIDPSLWLGSLLDKHFDKIKFVTPVPSFIVTKLEGNEVIEKTYRCDIVNFNTEKEIDDFFNESKWKTFVLFSITKQADLKSMTTSYIMRYSDITEKFEERDNKLKDILDNGTDNN